LRGEPWEVASQRMASEPNPYESPRTAGGYESDDPAAIAIWRDGKEVVLHQQASFPAVCIWTGEPADRFIPFRLKWHYPIDWSTRVLRVQLPFCTAGYRKFRTRRLWGAWIATSAVGISLGCEMLLSTDIPHGLALLIFFGGGLAGLLLRTPPLKFVRVRGEYLWFTGACSNFLANLPPWPQGH